MDPQRSRGRPGRRTAPAALLFAALCAATAAIATVGDHTRIKLLGYESATRRVCFVETSYRGEPALPRVLTIEPGARGAAPVEHTLWEGRKTELDLPSIFSAIQEFAGTLEPLEPYGPDGWRLETAIERHDTIQDRYFGHDIERFLMRLTLEAGPFRADTLVTAYFNRMVAVYGIYVVPGGREAIAHFSFTGDPFETGYLTDALLVLPRGEKRGEE